jgi:hypothetical protein
MDAVETVMLIKQGKDKGFSLEAAIQAAARFKAAQAAVRAGGKRLAGRARSERRLGRRGPAEMSP